MKAVVTRVKNASVVIGGQVHGAIGQGLLVLLGVHKSDTEAQAEKIADRICGLRIFEDENGKINVNPVNAGAANLLIISQFTLFGDARSQRRPGFTGAARPDKAIPMYEGLVQAWRDQGIHVETGVFGADMQVSLTNDGPVTMLMDSTKLF